MPTNRITDDDCTTEEREATSATTSTVRAYQVWAWRCPDCTKMHLSEMSSTHRSHCRYCGKAFTVEIKR